VIYESRSGEEKRYNIKKYMGWAKIQTTATWASRRQGLRERMHREGPQLTRSWVPAIVSGGFEETGSQKYQSSCRDSKRGAYGVETRGKIARKGGGMSDANRFKREHNKSGSDGQQGAGRAYIPVCQLKKVPCSQKRKEGYSILKRDAGGGMQGHWDESGGDFRLLKTYGEGGRERFKKVSLHYWLKKVGRLVWAFEEIKWSSSAN